MNIKNTIQTLKENYKLIDTKKGYNARIAASAIKIKGIIPNKIEIYKKENSEFWLCDPSEKIPTIIKILENKKYKILNLENKNIFN